MTRVLTIIAAIAAFGAAALSTIPSSAFTIRNAPIRCFACTPPAGPQGYQPPFGTPFGFGAGDGSPPQYNPNNGRGNHAAE